MSNIIRSPSISEEKRKLSTRRKQKESQSVDPVVSEAETVAEQNKNKLNSLVEQARQAVLGQFKEEAEAARELGRQRGLREGRLAGIEEAKQSFANEIARVKSIADNLPEAIKTGIAGVWKTCWLRSPSKLSAKFLAIRRYHAKPFKVW